LFADRAVSERELEDARRELQLAQETVQAGRRAAELFSGASAGQGAGSWRLIAPIAGTLVSVDATPGASVAAGQRLFRIVDTRELWLRARVPEQDAARLRTTHDARYRIAGLDDWRTIDVTGDDASAHLINVARTVDTLSRTVEVIYALHTPDPALRVGGLVRVSLPAGEDFTGVVVPRGALLDHEGRDVVYVQLDGEHFEQRVVRKGPLAGERAGLLQGVEAGERVVSRGAHLVRLADRPRGGESHGHIH
jgi:RND family efflux transporter MFP subunit